MNARIIDISKPDLERLLRSDARSWVDFNRCFPAKDPGVKYICVVHNGTIMFIMMYYKDFRQIGYWCNPKNRGKGIGSRLLTSCLSYIKENYEPDALFAKVNKDNVASSKTALRSGFSLMTNTGKDNVYVWYGNI